jgi:fructose-1,6-bisphosphatase/inositol monophosphatase family enzyme
MPLEAHERFSYAERSGVRKLWRLVALCAACHEVTRFGLANVKGRASEALAHLMRVRSWDEPAARAHIREAGALWISRNAVAWQLDLSILVEAGIRVASRDESVRRAKDRAAARLGRI